MKNMCHASTPHQQKKINPYDWYEPTVHHIISFRPRNVFLKFMDLCESLLQVRGPLIHLTLKNITCKTLLYFLHRIYT